MPETFPFPYYGHGVAYSRKAMEVVLWFRRPIPVARRKLIEKALPGPLGSVYGWGRQWLHAGSHGDTYEYEVAEAVRPDFEAASRRWQDGFQKAQAAKDPKALKAFLLKPNPALGEPDKAEWDAFERQLEAFARKLHAQEPLAFFFKPSSLGDWWDGFSPWHAWSVRQYRAQVEPWLAKEKAPAARVVVSWVRTAFLEDLEAMGDEAGPQTLEEVEALFDGDGLRGHVHELSADLSALRTNASLLAARLEGLSGPARAKALAGLKPYTQLAFYAAWPRHVAWLRAQKGWPERLARLAKGAGRPGALVSSLLWRIARVCSGHEGDVAKAAADLPLDGSREAAPVWRLCLGYPDPPVRAWLEASNTLERLEDWPELLAVSQRAEARLRKLPRARRQIDPLTSGDALEAVYTNLVYAAQKLGRDAVAREAARRSAGLGSTDPRLLLNQLYTLIRANDFRAAWRAAHAYRKAGGPLTPEVLVNLTAIYPRALDAKSELSFLREAVKRCQGSDRRYIRNAALLENLGWTLNERGEFDTLLGLLDRYDRQPGARPTALLMDRRLYAQLTSRRDAAALKQATRVLADYRKRPAFWRGNAQALANAACAFARAKKADGALKSLRAAVALGYDLSRARQDPDLKPMFADPRFAALG